MKKADITVGEYYGCERGNPNEYGEYWNPKRVKVLDFGWEREPYVMHGERANRKFQTSRGVLVLILDTVYAEVPDQNPSYTVDDYVNNVPTPTGWRVLVVTLTSIRGEWNEFKRQQEVAKGVTREATQRRQVARDRLANDKITLVTRARKLGVTAEGAPGENVNLSLDEFQKLLAIAEGGPDAVHKAHVEYAQRVNEYAQRVKESGVS